MPHRLVSSLYTSGHKWASTGRTSALLSLQWEPALIDGTARPESVPACRPPWALFPGSSERQPSSGHQRAAPQFNREEVPEQGPSPGSPHTVPPNRCNTSADVITLRARTWEAQEAHLVFFSPNYLIFPRRFYSVRESTTSQSGPMRVWPRAPIS